MVNQNSFIFIACRPSGIIAILFWLCIALLLSGDASAANTVTNGDFETGDTTGWTITGTTAVVDTDSEYTGTYGLSYDIHVAPWGGGKTLIISQNVDFTNVNNISFYYNVLETAPNGLMTVKIDGDTIMTDSSVNAWTYFEDSISYSGIKLLEFRFTVYSDSPAPSGIRGCIDDVVADDTLPTININARVTHADTPLTGIIINDENSTGGFPNENGERYLTPNEKASKEYIIDLSGNELQDGFKLEVSASSTEVTKLTIEVSNLIASRNYDVYLDDQWIEKIGEVTTYQYDITSFSLHTLELVHATGEEEDGGGSGPVTPPDEDITPPPDEDEIIIEDDVITIGELVLTKDEFDLLTIEQIEALNVSQDVKDELIRIKSINVNWWKIVLGLCLMAAVIEGSRKEGNEIIIVIGVIGVIIAAYKLGYLQL